MVVAIVFWISALTELYLISVQNLSSSGVVASALAC